jgi:DNA-directed RNA polymerase subunit RPC12/RpoP
MTKKKGKTGTKAPKKQKRTYLRCGRCQWEEVQPRGVTIDDIDTAILRCPKCHFRVGVNVR